MVSTLRRVRAALNPTLDIEGVLLTMYDERTNLGQQVATEVRQFFQEKTFNTVIPRNVRLGEAAVFEIVISRPDQRNLWSESFSAQVRQRVCALRTQVLSAHTRPRGANADRGRNRESKC